MENPYEKELVRKHKLLHDLCRNLWVTRKNISKVDTHLSRLKPRGTRKCAARDRVETERADLLEQYREIRKQIHALEEEIELCERTALIVKLNARKRES